MTIGVVIFILFTFMGYAVGQGQSGAALQVLGYLVAFVGITILLIFGCIAGYTYLVHSLWNM